MCIFAAAIIRKDMIKRELENKIRHRLFTGKAIILMGARQVGKTTLLKQLFSANDDVYWMSGDDSDVRSMFENISATRLRAVMGNRHVLVIDEAQRITDIGVKLKLVTDQMPDVSRRWWRIPACLRRKGCSLIVLFMVVILMWLRILAMRPSSLTNWRRVICIKTSLSLTRYINLTN